MHFFPFGNMHELNLDWFISKWNDFRAEWKAAQDGIENALQDEIDRAEAALSDVFTARDVTVNARDVTIDAKNDALNAKADALQAAANAAQYWENAASSARSAADSALSAINSERNASNSASAAQLSATQAGNSATAAQEAATQAGNSSTAAQDSATSAAADRAAVAQDKDDVDLLKDGANAAALRAEGWSSGTQNGVEVERGSPYYQNNAKYFSETMGTLGNIAYLNYIVLEYRRE